MKQSIAWRKSLTDHPMTEAHDSGVHIAYQSSQEPDLIRLTERFPIRERFEGHNDFDRIRSLMSYVHGIAPKNGDMASPDIKNTEEIMKAAKRGALWCWDYAVVFTEALLSMGVKAALVSCLPRVFDCDCHVGVMAYMRDRAKWAYFDPTFNTYFYGAAPMDIFEVRSAYARGETPSFRHITIDTAWKLTLNGIEYADYDSWYADYMLKNTFRFSLPLNSAYGRLTPDCKSVSIMPKGYDTINEYDAPGTIYTQDPGCILQS